MEFFSKSIYFNFILIFLKFVIFNIYKNTIMNDEKKNKIFHF